MISLFNFSIFSLYDTNCNIVFNPKTQKIYVFRLKEDYLPLLLIATNE